VFHDEANALFLCVCLKQVLKCAETYKMCIMSHDVVAGHV